MDNRYINNCVMDVLTCKADKKENEKRHLLSVKSLFEVSRTNTIKLFMKNEQKIREAFLSLTNHCSVFVTKV